MSLNVEQGVNNRHGLCLRKIGYFLAILSTSAGDTETNEAFTLSENFCCYGKNGFGAEKSAHRLCNYLIERL